MWRSALHSHLHLLRVCPWSLGKCMHNEVIRMRFARDHNNCRIEREREREGSAMSEMERNPNYFLFRANSSFTIMCSSLFYDRDHIIRVSFLTRLINWKSVAAPYSTVFYVASAYYLQFFYCYCFYREQVYVFGTHKWCLLPCYALSPTNSTVCGEPLKRLNSANDLPTHGSSFQLIIIYKKVIANFMCFILFPVQNVQCDFRWAVDTSVVLNAINRRVCFIHHQNGSKTRSAMQAQRRNKCA